MPILLSLFKRVFPKSYDKICRWRLVKVNWAGQGKCGREISFGIFAPHRYTPLSSALKNREGDPRSSSLPINLISDSGKTWRYLRMRRGLT
jgi:hypothetical protein